MFKVDMDHLKDTLLAEQRYWIHVVEATQQASTWALELIKGATCSWAIILQNGKFEHLPTTTPIPSKETAQPAKPADLTTPSSTSRTNSENCNAGANKTHKKKGQKRKSSADINKDRKGHDSLWPDRGRQERVSHRKALDADNSNLRLISQHNSLSRREKSNITAALKAPPEYLT